MRTHTHTHTPKHSPNAKTNEEEGMGKVMKAKRFSQAEHHKINTAISRGPEQNTVARERERE